MFELKTEYLFDIRLSVAPPSEFISVGNGGWGNRGIAPITGGKFQGPKIKGTVKPGGADWFLIRQDNAFILDVRILLETDDGASIYMPYDGIMVASDEVVEKLAKGGFPSEAQCLSTPRFETSHERYKWLNKIKGAATGRVVFDPNEPFVEYSVYALR